MTNFQAFQRKCDDTHLFQHHPSHYVSHQHGCISECWLSWPTWPYHCSGQQCLRKWVWTVITNIKSNIISIHSHKSPERERLTAEHVMGHELKCNRRILTTLTWFIPALANSKVGSSWGIVDDEWTYSCCFFWMKKSMKHFRISFADSVSAMAMPTTKLWYH